MAVSSVDLIVNAVKAINPLRQVNKESVKLGQSMTRTQRVMRNLGVVGARATRKLKDGFDRAARGARALAQKVGGLKGALVGLGLGAVTKSFVNQAAQFSQTQIRLRALAGEYGEYDQVQKLIAKNAKTFNLSLAESASQFADIFARLRPVGKSLDEIQTTFKGFNAVAIVSGTSAGAASAAFLQLSQALGSGRLQGDEFRSISEQLPGILKLVADQMKVNVADLKKLGSEGAITADILINALAKGFDENADKIEAILEQSPAAKFKSFSNAVSGLSVAVGNELLPVITPLVEKATDLLKQIGGLPEPIRRAAGGVLLLGTAAAVAAPFVGGLALALNGIGAAQLAALGKIGLIIAAVGGTGLLVNELAKSMTRFDRLVETGSLEELEAEAAFLEKTIKSLQESTDAEGDKLTGMGTSAATASSDLSDLQKKLKRVQLAIANLTDTDPEQGAFDFSQIQAAIAEAEKAMKPKPLTEEQKRLLERTQEQKQASSELLRISTAELKIMGEQSATDKIRLQFALRKANTEAKYKNLLSKALSDEERRNLKASELKELDTLRLQRNQEITQALQDQFKMYDDLDTSVLTFTGHTQELSEEFKSIADTINNEILNGIQGMIDGTKTLGDVASSMLRRIANQMLEMAIMGKQGSGGLAGSLFSAVSSIFNPVSSLAGPGGFTSPGVLTSGLDFSSAFSGGFANGGRPPIGKAALVGERGPELFVPDRAGTIVPNHMMGGANVTVNVDASGSSVQGDGPSAQQLGKAIGAAVQAELIKQKRPGGLLTR